MSRMAETKGGREEGREGGWWIAEESGGRMVDSRGEWREDEGGREGGGSE